MGGNRPRETFTSFLHLTLSLSRLIAKIFTHVGVVIPRVPATCTPLASFREVVHVRVTKSISTYNMKKLDKIISENRCTDDVYLMAFGHLWFHLPYPRPYPPYWRLWRIIHVRWKKKKEIKRGETVVLLHLLHRRILRSRSHRILPFHNHHILPFRSSHRTINEWKKFKTKEH